MTIENGTNQNWPPEVIIHTDGASRGNPGAASLGLIVTDSDENMIYEYAEALGIQTNNFAEYTAVKKALELARMNHPQKVIIKSDSQLLIRQMMGEYKVKSPAIKPLFVECKELVSDLPKVEFIHVRREFNKRADELANLVLDQVF